MSFEPQVFTALAGLVDGRVWPDIAPERVEKPYITHQQVGGDAVNYTEGAIPDRRNARIQINVWAETREEAAALAEQVENALRPLRELQVTVLGARISLYEPETKLRGTRQDFSIWY